MKKETGYARKNKITEYEKGKIKIIIIVREKDHFL